MPDIQPRLPGSNSKDFALPGGGRYSTKCSNGAAAALDGGTVAATATNHDVLVARYEKAAQEALAAYQNVVSHDHDNVPQQAAMRMRTAECTLVAAVRDESTAWFDRTIQSDGDVGDNADWWVATSMDEARTRAAPTRLGDRK